MVYGATRGTEENWRSERRRTLEETDALDLVLAHWALHETPGIVELCLHRNMRLGELLLILQPQNLREMMIMVRAHSHACSAEAEKTEVLYATSSSSKDRDSYASAADGSSVGISVRLFFLRPEARRCKRERAVWRRKGGGEEGEERQDRDGEGCSGVLDRSHVEGMGHRIHERASCR